MRDSFAFSRISSMKWRLDAGQIEVVDDAIAEVLRRKTPAERVAMIFAANRTMRLIIEGSCRTFHPEWDEATVQRNVSRRMSGGTA
jgi:hypothetical protein